MVRCRMLCIGQLVMTWLLALLIGSCGSLGPAYFGPDESYKQSRPPPSGKVAVAFFENAFLGTQMASWGGKPPGISGEARKNIEDRFIAGMRGKGYSPVHLGSFPSQSVSMLPIIPAIFARDIKPDREESAYLSSMERKRKELLQKAKEAGADSLLILPIITMRTASFIRLGAMEETSSPVSRSSLYGSVGWLALDGQWLQWEYPFLGVETDSFKITRLDKNKVFVVDIADETWTAGFQDAVLKRIPSFP